MCDSSVSRRNSAAVSADAPSTDELLLRQLSPERVRLADEGFPGRPRPEQPIHRLVHALTDRAMAHVLPPLIRAMESSHSEVATGCGGMLRTDPLLGACPSLSRGRRLRSAVSASGGGDQIAGTTGRPCGHGPAGRWDHGLPNPVGRAAALALVPAAVTGRTHLRGVLRRRPWTALLRSALARADECGGCHCCERDRDEQDRLQPGGPQETSHRPRLELLQARHVLVPGKPRKYPK